MRQREKPFPNCQSRFLNRTAEIEFLVFEFLSRFRSAFRKPTLRTPLGVAVYLYTWVWNTRWPRADKKNNWSRRL